MLIILECSRPVQLKPFRFKAQLGKGMNYRAGWLCFAIALITKHDYVSYHNMIESGTTYFKSQ